MKGFIKKFNPLEMAREDVLALATGREKLLDFMLGEMRNCLDKSGQHYIIYGPRGIGKSFFTRLLKIHHDQSEEFSKSIFIQLPEEQENINFTSDLMDVISTVLEGGRFADKTPRWTITDGQWAESVSRLEKALEKARLEQSIEHIFVTQENMQVFIPKLDDTESGRMREFLSDFEHITLIGSSLRPDLDSDYSKKLFQVFQKVDLKPWTSNDFLLFYERKAKNSAKVKEQLEQLQKSRNKIKAIAKFTGGSPRLAVILSELILDKNILDTTLLLDGIIDDLTTYYQDLTNDIPPKSKILFDMLIRTGENKTQSSLAASFNPPLQQNTIARSFSWLIENYYIVSKKQSKGNTKLFFVRDRLYVLYYQKRQVYADVPFSFVGIFVDFLTEYFTQREWKNQLNSLNLEHPYCQPLLYHYSRKLGLSVDANSDAETLRNQALNFVVKAEEDHLSKKQINEVISLLTEHRYEDAHHLAKGLVINDPKDPSLYSLLGISLEALDKLDEAIQSYQKGLELRPDYSFSLYRLGEVYRKREDFEKAVEYHKKATEIEPKTEQYHYAYAQALQGANKIKEAQKEYQEVIRLAPEEDEAYFNLGIIHGELGESKEAIYHFRKVLEIKPDDAITLLNLAIEHENIGDVKGAIDLYLQSIDIEERADTYGYLAALYSETTDYEKALDCFNRSLILDPNNQFSRSNLGILYLKKDNPTKALETIKSGVKKDPESPLLLTVLYTILIKLQLWDELRAITHELEINTLNASFGIGNAIGEILVEQPVIKDRFYLFKQVLEIINEKKEYDNTRVITMLGISVYMSKNHTLLRQIVEELKVEEGNSLNVMILVQVLEFLSSNKEKDIEKLHPDARMVVEVIKNLENDDA